jgi:flavin reductase (DIM6/NTAB) family NADH-FMN oxidoreductase RutF
MNTDVEYLEFLWPMRHYLVTCGDLPSKANIIAISFCMPVSKEQPLIACAIGRGAYSCTVQQEIETNDSNILSGAYFSYYKQV